MGADGLGGAGGIAGGGSAAALTVNDRPVLVVGGSRTTPGAVLLAGVSALRAGAGVVVPLGQRDLQQHVEERERDAFELGVDHAQSRGSVRTLR